MPAFYAFRASAQPSLQVHLWIGECSPAPPRLRTLPAGQTSNPASSGCINTVVRRGNERRSPFLSSVAEPHFFTVSGAFRSTRAPIPPMSLS